MTDFVKEGRVGDRVWDIKRGYGNIDDFEQDDDYPVLVLFDDGKIEYFTKEGKVYVKDLHATLFWDKPQIISPDKPVRKVKRWLCGFCSLQGRAALYGSNMHPILYKSESGCPKDSIFKVEIEIDEKYV